MATPLHNLALDKHEHHVGVADCAQTVRNHEGGAPLQQRLKRALNLPLCACVHAARRLVEDEHTRIGQGRTCNREQLTLTLTQTTATLPKNGIVAITQARNELIGTRQLGRRNHLLIGRLGAAVADVVHHRVAKEESVLQHHADLPAQRPQLYITHIHAVDGHAALRHVIEARQQVDHGRLACTRGADNRNRLPGLRHKVHVPEHRLARHILGTDIARRPRAPEWRAWLRRPVSPQCQVLQVKQLKDALGPGNRALDVGPQRADLRNRLVEALHIADEGDDQANRDDCAADRHIAQQKRGRPRPLRWQAPHSPALPASERAQK